MKTSPTLVACALAALALGHNAAQADAITDWNIKSGELIAEARLGTPPAVRVMALVQTAAFQAVNGITRRYATISATQAAPSASLDAAVAAAHRGTLLKLLPAQQAMIEAACQAALAPIADGPAKTAGVAAGEQAAAELLAQRAADALGGDSYRPFTSAGTYVPTGTPAAVQWPQRKPWAMANPAQFRPAPPPALTSDTWARDYNETRLIGARNSTQRTAEQTDIARFWDYSLPAVYHGVLRSVALQPGRELTRNARLFAVAAQAMDDALIAVFEAKYHYNFWRPTTAIRNGDQDGNDHTPRDATWAALIDVPLHPEYPSAHSVLAASVGTVLKADLAGAPVPVLSTSSPTLKGATRRWSGIDEFVQEVSESRVYGGIHFRSALEAGLQMGRRVGELTLQKHAAPAVAMATTRNDDGHCGSQRSMRLALSEACE